MTTISNSTKSKSVRITADGQGAVHAAYFQTYNGEEQVLQFKTFANIKNAEHWAAKVLA